MADTETLPQSPIQSTAPLEQNGSYPVLGTIPEPETPQIAYSPSSVTSESPTARRLHPAQEKHLWNSESARLAGLKSAEARRQRKLNPPKPPTIQSPPLEAVNPRLELVREQIELTRATLNDERTEYCPACERSGMEPHHRAALLRALDSLLDRERIMLGIPGPGTLKPQAQSSRRRPLAQLEPQPASEPVPTAINAPACGVSPAPTPSPDTTR